MYVRGDVMNFKDIQSLKARHSKEEFESIEVVRGGSVGIESISMMER